MAKVKNIKFKDILFKSTMLMLVSRILSNNVTYTEMDLNGLMCKD